MQADIFKDILVPVIGGLGIFMLGLEFMSNGIQALSVNKMRALLAKIAGTPIKGVLAGTAITGVIQSSTAMTVMVVGLVNAGVIGLRPAISVIMGANIGTTLGNGLIALPLGPLGLILGGIFALIYVFAKTDKIKNIALACMGFALIFYGLNLMTGGLRPLRNMPEVMSAISVLKADNLMGLIYCVMIAAFITALIHSSSATIGIVMGLGSAGVLDWQTAVAFSLGADLGTTITSWMASLNLSKNAKRAAYAHISFNVIGVGVVLALFFPAIWVLGTVLHMWGIDPGTPIIVDGQETFPGVPIAVGAFSIVFNIFNMVILFPFVSTFERVLSRVGHTSAEDIEDYSVPRYLSAGAAADFKTALPAVQQEAQRHLQAAAVFLDVARNKKGAPADPTEHAAATDALSREIRAFSSRLFQDGLSRDQLDLVASMIEEVDFTSSLSETLYQIARRVKREPFSTAAVRVLDQGLEHVDQALNRVLFDPAMQPRMPSGHSTLPSFEDLRWQVLGQGDIQAGEKGALIALLGSIERAENLVQRIVDERGSVDRSDITRAAVVPPVANPDLPPAGDIVPAE